MNSNDMKKRLYAELQVKIEREYGDYMDSLYHLSVEDVIGNSYKTVIMSEFKGILENSSMESLGLAELEKIIQIDNLLEKLYNKWIGFDSDEIEVYKEFVFGNWDFS